MRILVAEDDFTSRNVLVTVMKKTGFDVVEAVDGAVAWELLQHPDSPNLIVLDWMMPEMNGLEVVTKIRALQTEQPPYIIMLTSKDKLADVIAGLEAGANDYLAKPFDVGELKARVEVGRRVVEMQEALAAKIEELQQASEQIKTLSGILPICSSCKDIRNEKGCWQQVETYVQEHTETVFSHGLCPDCAEKQFPHLDEAC